MAEQTLGVDEVGTRFPFIKLEAALGRAKQLYDAAGEHQLTVPDAFLTWAYSAKSSGGHQTVSALKMYGLLADSGYNEQRRLTLTRSAIQYFRDEREDVLAEMRREFAVSPPLLGSLWERWGASPPADNIARSYLKIDRGLSDQNARAVLGIYKENLVFADFKGLSNPAEKMQKSGLKAAAQPIHESYTPAPVSASVAEGERVVFTEEVDPAKYVKLIASGPLDDILLEALEDFVKRQRKRLNITSRYSDPAYRAAREAALKERYVGGDSDDDMDDDDDEAEPLRP